MKVRPGTAADHDAVRRVVSEAFGGPAEARLVELLRASDAYVADLELVAEVDGEVVGHILFTRVRVGDRRALALAPMAVAPSYQRSGVGTALVRAGLERAAARPEAAVIVLGHPEYYPRFGFVPACRFGIEPPWPRVPDEAFLVLPLPAYSDACRGVVVYPAAFDSV
ncbi:MAG TPA: N-acetyltransferase [Acidimicrobiales bacterium]|nr:N-acetyltransferase [Acidimicrobiales bacterium]